jgi:L-rhamnose mutarotase
MTAYNIVRMRVKPGFEDQFVAHHDNLVQGVGDDLKTAGMRRFSLVKTGDRSYCFIGEWEGFDSIVEARPAMIGSLDQMRDMLEDLGDDLGVTDPVSGEAVAEYDMRDH